MADSLQEITNFVIELRTVPAELMELQYQPQSFGSWQLVVRKSGKNLRIIYDGRDDFFALQNMTPEKKWSDVWSGPKQTNWPTEIIFQLKRILNSD